MADLAGAQPDQHAVQVWEVTAQSAEDAAALAASQIRAVLEQLKSNGVTEGRIGMVEVDGKYYVVVDVEVTEENTFEPAKPVSDDDDSEDTPSVPAPTATVDGNKIDLSSLTVITAKRILDLAGGNYDKDDITELDLRNCTGLTSIGNPGDGHGSGAFQGCKSLKTVILPTSLESIGDMAFADSGLTEINLSDCTNLKSIGDGAFVDCESLTSINLSGCTSLQSIYGSAFASSGLTSINLSGCTNLTSIGESAFDGCGSLKEVNLSGCTRLESIGSYAFFSTSLTSINLSGCTKLTTISEGAFESCEKLTSIDLHNTQVENHW